MGDRGTSQTPEGSTRQSPNAGHSMGQLTQTTSPNINSLKKERRWTIKDNKAHIKCNVGSWTGSWTIKKDISGKSCTM